MQLKNKLWNIIYFNLKRNYKYLIFFGISVLVISLIVSFSVTSSVPKNAKFTIANSEIRMEDSSVLGFQSLSGIYNLILLGPIMICLILLINIFFINKIFTSEIKSGEISFWLSSSLKRSHIYIIKLLTINLVTTLMFLPLFVCVIIFGSFAYDSNNLDKIVFTVLEMFLVLLTFNSLIIFINQLCKENGILFACLVGVIMLLLLIPSFTYNIYKTNPNDWKMFQYNRFFSLELIAPSFLYSNDLISDTIQTDTFKQTIFSLDKPKLNSVLIGVGINLIIWGFSTILGLVIWSKKDFAKL
ncbi:hypothetical protein ESOMN_v1c06050 [Williamsoniiplasma somnilux]|uniref:Uncharacterized protein n=1 Tax=Williamsoniiplasma somnilux TaxID=215578 RepID=A0A2K8NYX3_9MOLU|nr:hypothetical protein [Williamsoniiplasma somnilux]ATZ18987.1 hypothetical protein ESOMN_v1c06050 [Williamsoniiplasma somnilux]